MLIGIMGMYMLNEALFTHSHITAQGEVITHAHPYDKSDSAPFKHHQHSKNELLVFNALKIWIFFSGIVITLIVSRPAFKLIESGRTFLQQISCFSRSGRSPPTICFNSLFI
jgi:hypothetical protein